MKDLSAYGRAFAIHIAALETELGAMKNTAEALQAAPGPTLSKNERVLNHFIDYCQRHPEQRFWQALRNWCGFNFVLLTNDPDRQGEIHDTFYWEGRNGSR